MTNSQQSAQNIRDAIKKTEYKYFGDYEMSDDQREAVDVLVAAAETLLGLRDDKGDLVAKLRAKGETVPDRIWLHGIGGHAGEVTWANEPDPSGDPDEAAWAVEYVLAAPA